MGDKKEYRSAVRSRRLIRQAFLELLKEKPLEKITVTDIVKRADVNRSTFYAHYPDVVGVVEEISNEIIEFTRIFMENIEFTDFFENPLPHLRQLIQIAEENIELYRWLCFSPIGAEHLERVKDVLIERTLQTTKPSDEHKSAAEFEFRVRFFMGGVLDVYTQWMKGKMDCTLDEVTEQLAQMIARSNKGE